MTLAALIRKGGLHTLTTGVAEIAGIAVANDENPPAPGSADRLATVPAVKPVRQPTCLPEGVRHRFHQACTRLRMNPAPVLTQFDLWNYTQYNLLEMAAWPEDFIEAHCRVLADEYFHGFEP